MTEKPCGCTACLGAPGPWQRWPWSMRRGVRRPLTDDDVARWWPDGTQQQRVYLLGLSAEVVTDDDGSPERLEIPTMSTTTGECWLWVLLSPPNGWAEPGRRRA